MSEYAIIKVRPKVKKVFQRLAKKHELNMLDFTESMGEYFDMTGVNPKDMKVLSPAEELKKFRDTIISFMRKQEKDFILPVFGKMDIILGRFMEYIEHEAPKREAVEIGEYSEITAQNLEEQNESSDMTELKLKLQEAELKNKNIKENVLKIFENSEMKSTGLSKKIVVELNKTEFDQIGDMVKLM